jgi:hypothetical protein
VKHWALATFLFGVATATVVVPFTSHGTRSVRPLAETLRTASTKFDRRQSAALFVGIRDFDAAQPVPYAVDDAVDLAYAFAIDGHCRLVPPRRAVLVLSGRVPVKPESRERLRQLRDAGADVRYAADAASVRAALREQSALAGRDGVLVVSIASHGLLHNGAGYILGVSSSPRELSTMVPSDDVFETIASSAAQRSLVFMDACRERMAAGTRSVLASGLTAAPIIERRLSHTRGQAVFYAAAAGQWAYDDPEARNGVFTRAVIEGMSCGASKVRNAVTAETLAAYVERAVHSWVREHRDPSVGSATQSSIDGEAQNMPIACCGCPAAGPKRAGRIGTTVRAFDADDQLLWVRDAGAGVSRAEAVDLDGDGWNEVVFGTSDSLRVLDDKGDPRWSAHESMTLTAFATGDLNRRRTNEVVAIWNGDGVSRLTLYDPEGKRTAAFDDSRHLDRVLVGRATNRHKPRIVATSDNTVLVFEFKKLEGVNLLWSRRVSRRSDPIASVDVADGDGDGRNEIALTTASGAKKFFDFDGEPR